VQSSAVVIAGGDLHPSSMSIAAAGAARPWRGKHCNVDAGIGAGRLRIQYREERARAARPVHTSIFSAISRASSTSTPR